MDITSIYRSRLESIKKLQKDIPSELQNSSSATNNNNAIGAKSKLFPGKKSEYYVKARELCSTISSLKDFLVENRKAYLNFGSGPRNNGSSNSSFSSSTFGKNSSAVWKNLNNTKEASFSDIERDQIDDDVQKIIRNCQKKIFEYDKLIETSDIVQSCPQLHTHLENIHNSLADYLKDVCTIHSGMRAVRVKRTVDYQTMSKLASHRHKNSSINNNKSAHSSTTDSQNPSSLTSSSSSSSCTNNTTSTTTTHTTSATSSSKSKSSRRSTSHSNNNIDHDQTDHHQQHGTSSDSNVPAYFEEEPSAEELQIFEAENAQLLNELNTVSDEVDQVATNVLQIAQLQEEITSKILEQDIHLDRIANVVVGATENIRGGNEQIRQAIQKNADFRAWVLFFIIVMSFSLLFLDWYND